jgi:MFS family permease
MGEVRADGGLSAGCAGKRPAVRFKGPLADSYPAAVVLVVCALVPYLVLTSALTPLMQVITKDLGMSNKGFQLTEGLADAGYAFGTVLAVQLAQHLRQRRMLLLYVALFVLGSIATAAATVPWLFAAGHILQGTCTSLMLIAAVPPLVIGWPVEKTKWTAVTMNVCIFGAVALGPVVGGLQTDAEAWRPLFWAVTVIAAVALLFVLLTYEDQDPQDRSAPWDWVAQTLAGVGCAAAFFGASQLGSHSFTSAIALVPLFVGLVLIVALIVYEYRADNPLMPIERVATTFPVAGIIIAMFAGAASVGVVALTQTAMQNQTTPGHLAMLFWPEFGGALVTAVVFGALFRTRFVPVLPVVGMGLLTAGAVVLTGISSGSETLVLVGSGLLGLGVGASVSPALFTAGFSQASGQIQRVFALIELLRGVAAFLFAPIILHIATTVSGSPTTGVSAAMWICALVAALGGVLALLLYVLGRARLQEPDLEQWLGGDEPAIESPPLLARLRERAPSARV